MSQGSQLRHWIANARASQLGSALVSIGVLAALVVASIVVAPNVDEVSVGANGGQLTTPLGDVPGSAGASGDAGVGIAGGSTQGGSSGAPAGATTVGGGEVGSGESADGSSGPPVPLVASDRGITESTVLLGILYPDDALASLGFGISLRADFPQYMEALAAYVNRRGGVVGRSVEVTLREVDPVSREDHVAACTSMADDRQVFGVLDSVIAGDTGQSCITQTKETPFVHQAIWSEEFQARANGYDVGYAPSVDRIAEVLVRDLPTSGWMDSTSVVGIFSDNCPTDLGPINDILVPGIQATGAEVVVGQHDCNAQSAVQQTPSIATRFRTAGVTHVVAVANGVSIRIFLETANSLGGWRPEYAISDWWGALSDSTAANFNAAQFDGAIGFTSTRTPLVNAGYPAHNGIERCQEAAAEAGLAPVGASDTDFHLVMCDQFFLMLDGVAGAGPNPTRRTWAAAIQSLGGRQSVNFGPASFGPGKTNGADTVYTAHWHRDCTCWRADSGFREVPP